jgi:hypothetical protein
MSTHSKAELEFSDDYQTITFKGQPLYHLTPQQAAIVKLLHQSRYYEASTQTIRKQMKCGPIHNSFKTGDSPKIWKDVIVNRPQRLLPSEPHTQERLARRGGCSLSAEIRTRGYSPLFQQPFWNLATVFVAMAPLL